MPSILREGGTAQVRPSAVSVQPARFRVPGATGVPSGCHGIRRSAPVPATATTLFRVAGWHSRVAHLFGGTTGGPTSVDKATCRSRTDLRSRSVSIGIITHPVEDL